MQCRIRQARPTLLAIQVHARETKSKKEEKKRKGKHKEKQKNIYTKAISYAWVLKTENERFQFSKPIGSLTGLKVGPFPIKIFNYHFQPGLHSEMSPISDRDHD